MGWCQPKVLRNWGMSATENNVQVATGMNFSSPRGRNDEISFVQDLIQGHEQIFAVTNCNDQFLCFIPGENPVCLGNLTDIGRCWGFDVS